MPTFRDIKRKARLQLHDRMSEPALYLATAQDDPLGVTVRLHLSFDALGDLRNAGFAERKEYTPQIVFLASQVRPIHRAIVVTKDVGAWIVDNSYPPDDITINAEVTRMTDSQARALGWDPEMQFMGLAAEGEAEIPNYPPKIVLVTKGEPGEDGKSAYQIWLDQGNTGTEDDFLDSIDGAVWTNQDW